MTKCPVCGGYHERHSCPGRRNPRRAWATARATAVGAVAGWLIVGTLFTHVPWWAIVVAALVGVILESLWT
jgi:hypothetical protein